jgi:hypothetical protein
MTRKRVSTMAKKNALALALLPWLLIFSVVSSRADIETGLLSTDANILGKAIIQQAGDANLIIRITKGLLYKIYVTDDQGRTHAFTKSGTSDGSAESPIAIPLAALLAPGSIPEVSPSIPPQRKELKITLEGERQCPGATPGRKCFIPTASLLNPNPKASKAFAPKSLKNLSG